MESCTEYLDKACRGIHGNTTHLVGYKKNNKIFKVRGQRQTWRYIPGFEILSRDTQIAFERKKGQGKGALYSLKKKL